jgi:hypothetical protein
VFIGALSDVNGTDYFNVIALGEFAIATASNQARIGNTNTTSIGGYANWTNFSDGRYKKNVKDDVKGLDFIMKLRPVTYNLDAPGISEKLDEDRDAEGNDRMKIGLEEKEKVVQSGFIAQEVEKAAKELGYDFSGVDAPKNEKDFYGLRYAEFVVPLVKAVQELNKNQAAQIAQLKAENTDVKERLAKLERLQERLVAELARLQRQETAAVNLAGN